MRFALPVLLLILAAIATLAAGVRAVSVPEIWHALVAFDPMNPLHIVIHDIRLPRLIAGLAAGASLGMAGSIMQSLTRNPLADPGLMGVNAGAAFTIVLGAFLLGRADGGFIAALSFPGAALASLAVFAIGGGLRGEAGPVRLTLAGIALNALLMSLVSAIVLTRTEALEVFRFWAAGSLAQANVRPLLEMSAIAALGAGCALLLAPRLEALALGTGLAKGLGTKPGRIGCPDHADGRRRIDRWSYCLPRPDGAAARPAHQRAQSTPRAAGLRPLRRHDPAAGGHCRAPAGCPG